jgi:hypothetical protein
VIGFDDLSPALTLVRDGWLVTAVARNPSTLRRWRKAARDGLREPALARLNLRAAPASGFEAPPELYSQIVIGPELSWSALTDPQAWLTALLDPGGQVVIETAAGADRTQTLREVAGPIARDFRLVALEHQDARLTLRAERCTNRDGATDLADRLAELVLAQARQSVALEQLVAALRAAVNARDRVVLELRGQVPPGAEEDAVDDGSLAPRLDELAARIASSRRAVRSEREQIASMLASVDELLSPWANGR